MFISEDGTITGSVDVSKLDQVKPKSDEAKAQHESLLAEVKAGQEQAARDAERVAEQHRVQNAVLFERSAVNAQPEADEQSDAQQQAETQRLQAEAEAAGVTVDKRWGPDRLRQEITSAQSAKRKA